MFKYIAHNLSESEFQELISNAVRSELAGIKPQQQESDPVEFLTRKQVAERLQISLVSVHTWTKQGIIKGYRIAGRIRYKAAEIEASLQAMQTRKK